MLTYLKNEDGAALKHCADAALYEFRVYRMSDLMKTLNDKQCLRRCALIVCLILIPFFLYSFYWYQTSGRLSLLLLILLLATLMLALLIPFGLKALDSPKASITSYAAVLSFFAIIFVFIFPPLTVADEDHHFAATYWMASCALGEGSWNDSRTLQMRPEDESLLFEETAPMISESSYRRVLDNAELFSSNDELIAVDITGDFYLSVAGDNFVARIPSIIGVVIARILNLGAYPLFYLGRIIPALAFVVCCVLAVKITPVAKGAFIVASLLPMTLNLASSYSYDCGIISLSFLFLACAMKGIFGQDNLAKIDLVLLGVTAVLLAPCKVIYSLEFILLFFIPNKKFPSKKIALAFKGCVLLCAMSFIALLRMATLTSLAAGTNSLYSAGGTSVSLVYLLQHPVQTGILFIRTMIELGDFYFMSAIGSSLGWLQGDLSAPTYFILGYILCAVYSVQATADDTAVISFRTKFLYTLIVCGILFASMLALLLNWTSIDSTVIQGVQGRYILPAMPLIFMLFRFKEGRVSCSVIPFSFTCMYILNAFYLVQFFARALLLVA
ncbi:DUF2142 domain-containing protein [Enorma phocaeensis]|uniref:DUF2142 domain-containing protein n=1 Tax=Enorma phocaeensis TaxID=1871019 RepID=UPI003208FEBA